MTKFTDLPPEIRYMIYHYLLAPSKFKYKAFAEEYNQHLYFKYPLGQAMPKMNFSGLPHWLMTSRMLLYEGIDQFKRGGFMEIGPANTGAYDATAFPALLKPATFRNIHMQIRPEMYYHLDGTPNIIGRLEPKALSHCHELLLNTSNGSIKLKQLQIRTSTIKELNGDLSYLDHRADLGPFGKAVEPVAQQLTRLEFLISVWRVKDAKRDMFEDRLREQIEILDGGVLKGFGKGGTFTRYQKAIQDGDQDEKEVEWRILWTRG
jgi:hypothetical protein